MRILVVEDEPDMNRIITKKLAVEGYATDACFNGEEALAYIEAAEYDAVILDIMMPKLDGVAVLRRIRAAGNATPVIFLTARDAVADRVAGLDEGANDYLVKPFSLEELMARIRALIRGTGAAASATNVFTAADLVLDAGRHTVRRAGRDIELSAKEFAVLEYLIRNKNMVLSRDKIEQHIWNYDYEGGTNLVDVYIRYLRKKLDEGFSQKLIHTVRGSGYVLRAPE